MLIQKYAPLELRNVGFNYFRMRQYNRRPCFFSRTPIGFSYGKRVVSVPKEFISPVQEILFVDCVRALSLPGWRRKGFRNECQVRPEGDGRTCHTVHVLRFEEPCLRDVLHLGDALLFLHGAYPQCLDSSGPMLSYRSVVGQPPFSGPLSLPPTP